jgi:hypothetical protein
MIVLAKASSNLTDLPNESVSTEEEDIVGIRHQETTGEDTVD